MSGFAKFGYRELEDLEADVQARGLGIAFHRNVSVLGKPVRIGVHHARNALVIHPMEGRDADPAGKPGPLTFRRYERYARGGAGLIWFEGTAVLAEGRSSPAQLILGKENAEGFKELLARTRQAALDSGFSQPPICIVQLQDAGRHRRAGYPPAVVLRNPYWKTPADSPLLTDSQIECLEEKFVEAALLAADIGFEGADIKCSNGYLGCDFLSARSREGRYGGAFEGRTKFLLNIVEKIREQAPRDFLVTVRLNLHDGIPYPYGWGVSREDPAFPDLTEPIRLGKMLRERGVEIINTSNGLPEYNSHLMRPHGIPLKEVPPPPEHPLDTVGRIFKIVGDFQSALPGVRIVGTGYSWLRHFAGFAAAASVLAGRSALIGMGRMALACPAFPRDLLEKGNLDPLRVCVACGRCTQILVWGGNVGCALRDREIYGTIYRRLERQYLHARSDEKN